MMEVTMRAMTPAEHNYCYAQSQQISMQSGLIGHLRADMGSDGRAFYSSFFDCQPGLKTEAFRSELNEVISALRAAPLKDRSALAAYCRKHPDSDIDHDGREYGFRADTPERSFMLRLNPNRGEYNLYCYCYQRRWLDQHMRHAEQGIRFITPDYRELFRIPDGDCIRITDSDGRKRDCTCRYIDETHVELGGELNGLMHICEFAERMEKNGCTVIPLRSSLPERCASTLPSTGELILISRGQTGYSLCAESTDDPAQNRALADARNQHSGVTRAQEAAMLTGSMFGWQVSGADPKSYDENGRLLHQKQKTRDEAR